MRPIRKLPVVSVYCRKAVRWTSKVRKPSSRLEESRQDHRIILVNMKAIVHVTLKTAFSIRKAKRSNIPLMRSVSVRSASSPRQVHELDLGETDAGEPAQVTDMCEKLLANAVIENYKSRLRVSVSAMILRLNLLFVHRPRRRVRYTTIKELFRFSVK